MTFARARLKIFSKLSSPRRDSSTYTCLFTCAIPDLNALVQGLHLRTPVHTSHHLPSRYSSNWPIDYLYAEFYVLPYCSFIAYSHDLHPKIRTYEKDYSRMVCCAKVLGLRKATPLFISHRTYELGGGTCLFADVKTNNCFAVWIWCCQSDRCRAIRERVWKSCQGRQHNFTPQQHRRSVEHGCTGMP